MSEQSFGFMFILQLYRAPVSSKGLPLTNIFVELALGLPTATLYGNK